MARAERTSGPLHAHLPPLDLNGQSLRDVHSPLAGEQLHGWPSAPGAATATAPPAEGPASLKEGGPELTGALVAAAEK